jgi:hypothetical protein
MNALKSSVTGASPALTVGASAAVTVIGFYSLLKIPQRGFTVSRTVFLCQRREHIDIDPFDDRVAALEMAAGQVGTTCKPHHSSRPFTV